MNRKERGGTLLELILITVTIAVLLMVGLGVVATHIIRI